MSAENPEVGANVLTCGLETAGLYTVYIYSLCIYIHVLEGAHSPGLNLGLEFWLSGDLLCANAKDVCLMQCSLPRKNQDKQKQQLLRYPSCSEVRPGSPGSLTLCGAP